MQELVRAKSGESDEAHETDQLVLSAVGTRSTTRERVEDEDDTDGDDKDEEEGWFATRAERSSSEKRYCTRG